MSQPDSPSGARLGLTLVGRFEGAVVENGVATVKICAPKPPAGGESEPWQYLAVARIPAFDLTKQTNERLTVEGSADLNGLCDPCKGQKLQLQQDLARARTGLAEFQKAVAELEKKLKQAEANKAAVEKRTLPKLEDAWKAIEELAKRSWTFLSSAVRVLTDFFNDFKIDSETRKQAEDDLAAVQRAKAKADQMIKQIEDVRKNCPHFDPMLGAALEELKEIRSILRGFKLNNLRRQGKKLADAVNSAANAKQIASMFDGKPCETCVNDAQAAIDALTKQRDEAKQKVEEFSKEVEQLQAQLDAFPKDCSHTKPGQAG